MNVRSGGARLRGPLSVSRAGYTLLELLIVLGILSMVAGMALPALRHPLDRSRLRGAAGELQSILQKARAIAVREGWRVRLQFEPNGRKYRLTRVAGATGPVRIASDSGQEFQTLSGLSEFEPGSAAAAVLPSVKDNESTNGNVLKAGELPPGVTFSSRQISSDSGDRPEGHHTYQQRAGSEARMADTAWNDGPEFLPNGRTNDGSLQVRGHRGHVIHLRVRGITGTVTCSPAIAPVVTGAANEASAGESVR